ncbi:MAG: CHAT domain-containing protein [Algoriphagus sp.]|uniref:CHAT domain-containing protein n=1 Tax=Algoriphagus sp. TaxID=1872435 RepID=UPI0017FA8ACD|nr:CHAT domain-containing protein [Algoriphagus sp.]NVJ87293.1 CHAT domain-containing protein [Algoriphagus sp.]
MSKLSAFYFFLFFFLVSQASFGQTVEEFLKKADSLYFLPYPKEEDDLLAIEFYQKVINQVPGNDQVEKFIRAAENLGNLFLVYNEQQAAANSYRKALLYAKSFQKPDTLVYTTHLYLGEVLFRMSRLDSAILHLKEAEQIQGYLHGSAVPERLYNALGVYYFETGNYVQSIVYFSQAESYLEGLEDSYARFARYSFLSNKASALYHLELYDSARTIYRQLLGWEINQDQIRINLANTFLKEEKGQEALEVLEEIRDPNSSNLIPFLNLKSKAYLQLQELPKAASILSRVEFVLDSLQVPAKNYQRGTYYRNQGDFYRQKGEWEKSLSFYHLAIVELHPEFESNDYFSNPEVSTLGMSAISLFENLVSKAELAWRIYSEKNDPEYFQLGKETFDLAFSYAEYISTNFDNDEGRIFLGDQVIDAYRKGITSLFDFYSKGGEEGLKELAFLWAEQSKSGALRLGILETRKKETAGVPKSLLAEEKDLQVRLAINYRNQYEIEDTARLRELKQEYIGLQVELSRIKERIKDYFPEYSGGISLDLERIRSKLPAKGLVFSLFEGEEELHLFYLDKGTLSWKVTPWTEENRELIFEWKLQLRNWRGGMSYQQPEFIAALSEQFFTDDLELDDKEVLMIILHGIFSGVSFDEFFVSDGFLIEKIPILYQFSALRLELLDPSFLQSGQMSSFAPFSDSKTINGELRGLPGSLKEIESLPGEKYIGSEASKTKFLEVANQSQFLHLATHAIAILDPTKESFIAFYPEGDFRLFDSELGFQSFNQTELVFLSACETAAGRLSESEGLVSLARSFAMAGVEYLVSTLWLTEDQVATYISREFYNQVANGEGYAQALRLAKLKLLNDPEMAQFSESPYWSNFILIGQPQKKSGFPNWIIILIIAFVVGGFVGFWILNGRSREH